MSPLTRRLADRRWTASVSIRSGKGSSTHDRVLRLLPLFDNAHDAARYALGEGAAWIGRAASFTTQEHAPWPRKN